MRESCVIAAFYFRRMARKPLLLAFLLAIPFTLLLAEFAAFGRVSPAKQATPLPLRISRESGSQVTDGFVSCLGNQPGNPLTVSEDASGPGDLVTLTNSSPVRVTLHSTSASRVSSLLEYSILRVCALQELTLSPRAVTSVAERSSPSASSITFSRNAFIAHFFPGLGLFGALFLSQAMASLVWRDYERHAHVRLRTIPLSPVSLVLGPILFLTVGVAAALVLLFAVCASATNPSVLASPLFWALVLGFAICAAALQLVTGLMTRSNRAATAISSSTNMVLAFFGGGFVPLSLYPPFLRVAAYALPNGAGQTGIVQLLTGPPNLHEVMWRIATVLVWALILISAAIALQSRRLRT